MASKAFSLGTAAAANRRPLFQLKPLSSNLSRTVRRKLESALVSLQNGAA